MSDNSIEMNKDNNTLDIMESLEGFTEQFIRKTKGMSKKDMAFTVWEFGHYCRSEGITYQKSREYLQ